MIDLFKHVMLVTLAASIMHTHCWCVWINDTTMTVCHFSCVALRSVRFRNKIDRNIVCRVVQYQSEAMWIKLVENRIGLPLWSLFLCDIAAEHPRSRYWIKLWTMVWKVTIFLYFVINCLFLLVGGGAFQCS